jgi:pyroglutamyl-peptidase
MTGAAPERRTLVTGFLAFHGFPVNPSALLAEDCGRRFELIEVSYAAVDEFMETLDGATFDRLVLLGVAGTSGRMRFEAVAHNRIDDRPDVRGQIRGPAPIEPGAPVQMPGTLWTSRQLQIQTQQQRPSSDAGAFLCNYIYYRALRRFPRQAVGFLHVPAVERMSIDVQGEILSEALREVEEATSTITSDEHVHDSKRAQKHADQPVDREERQANL